MKIRKIISILAVLVLVLTVCTGCNSTKEKEKEKEDETTYEVVIKNYFNGMVEGDVEKYLSVYPEFMKMEDSIDEDDMEYMKEMLEDEYGEKLKVSYKVAEEEKIEKEELEYVEKYIEARYDEEVKVIDGYYVKVKATIKGEEDEETDTSEMYIYKIDGEWKYFTISPDTAKTYVEEFEDEE